VIQTRSHHVIQQNYQNLLIGKTMILENEKSLGTIETSLDLLEVLKDNSFDSILMTDSEAENEKSLGTTETSLALLKVLADNSFDSILMTDATAQGKIVYANRAFKKLTGHDPLEVIGQSPRILQGVGTDKKVIDRLNIALKTGKKFEGKAINYKKNGTPFIMYWRVLPIKVGKITKLWLAIQREGSVI
jgi:PAS domain S-box-containing protein